MPPGVCSKNQVRILRDALVEMEAAYKEEVGNLYRNRREEGRPNGYHIKCPDWGRGRGPGFGGVTLGWGYASENCARGRAAHSGPRRPYLRTPAGPEEPVR